LVYIHHRKLKQLANILVFESVVDPSIFICFYQNAVFDHPLYSFRRISTKRTKIFTHTPTHRQTPRP